MPLICERCVGIRLALQDVNNIDPGQGWASHLPDACGEVLAGFSVAEAVDAPLAVVDRIPVCLAFDFHSGNEQIVPTERVVHSLRRVHLEHEVANSVSDFTALERLKIQST